MNDNNIKMVMVHRPNRQNPFIEADPRFVSKFLSQLLMDTELSTDAVAKEVKRAMVNSPVGRILVEKDTGTIHYQIAVTGLSKEDCSITTKGNQILVKTNINNNDIDTERFEIKKSKLFTAPCSIPIDFDEIYDVKNSSADITNGLLTLKVPLRKEIAEANKESVIEIN